MLFDIHLQLKTEKKYKKEEKRKEGRKKKKSKFKAYIILKQIDNSTLENVPSNLKMP